MAAYAYYKAGKFDDAVSAADRYLTLHPGTQESDLAQNIIGMSYYDQVLDPKRDQTNRPQGACRPTRPCSSAIPTRAMRPRRTTGTRILRDLLGGERDDGRALLSAPQQLSCRDQPLPHRGHRLPDHRAGRRGLDAPDRGLYGVRHRQRGSNGGCRARPQLSGQQVVQPRLRRSCSRYGLQPQEHEGSWITQTWKGNANRPDRSRHASRPVDPRHRPDRQARSRIRPRTVRADRRDRRRQVDPARRLLARSSAHGAMPRSCAAARPRARSRRPSSLPPTIPSSRCWPTTASRPRRLLILRRVQGADGRTRAFINDISVSVQLLRQVGQALVEIHGQHDDRALIDPSGHRDLVDAFGGLSGEARARGRGLRGLAGGRRGTRAPCGRDRRHPAPMPTMSAMRSMSFASSIPKRGEEEALGLPPPVDDACREDRRASSTRRSMRLQGEGTGGARLAAALRRIERQAGLASGLLAPVAEALERVLAETECRPRQDRGGAGRDAPSSRRSSSAPRSGCSRSARSPASTRSRSTTCRR